MLSVDSTAVPGICKSLHLSLLARLEPDVHRYSASAKCFSEKIVEHIFALDCTSKLQLINELDR